MRDWNVFFFFCYFLCLILISLFSTTNTCFYFFFLKENDPRQRVYTPNLIKIIDASTAQERLTYMLFAHLGQLMPAAADPNSLGAVISEFVPRDIGFDNSIINVFDNHTRAWVEIDYNDIPRTYSFVPRPMNPYYEVDYFVRACGLIKHEYVWSTPSIPKETFAQVFHPRNMQNVGRYTIMPWLPSVKGIVRFERGYRQIADNTFMFAVPTIPVPPASVAPAAPAAPANL